MLKLEIKELSKRINLDIKESPYLEICGKWGDWYFKDNRTFQDNEGMFHVFPISTYHRSIYVVNPRTGKIETHSFMGKDYAGHRSQGYIVEDIAKVKNLSIGELKLVKKMNDYKNLYRDTL